LTKGAKIVSSNMVVTSQRETGDRSNVLTL
jgi:hypothetical protein